MKLSEILSNSQIKKAGQLPTVGPDQDEPEEAPKVDPTLEPKKRQLKTIQRQLDSLLKQKAQDAKLGRENMVIDKRIESLKKKMNDIKATMLDNLEVADK